MLPIIGVFSLVGGTGAAAATTATATTATVGTVMTLKGLGMLAATTFVGAFAAASGGKAGSKVVR